MKVNVDLIVLQIYIQKLMFSTVCIVGYYIVAFTFKSGVCMNAGLWDK